MNETQTIITEVTGTVLHIRLHRPEKRNALNDTTMLAVEAALSRLPEGVKCAVISGEGKHFSAGLDLSELREASLVEGIHHSQMWHRILDRVQFGTVPVIAVLHGACLGGGLELASACHIRVAERSTFYALPEGQRGIFVGGGAAVRLPKLIGIANMTDMMLTGRVYSAEEGERIGMAQYLVDEGAGLAKAFELAEKISGNAGLTNFALTQVLPRILDAGHDAGMMMESLIASITQDAPEAKERLAAFLAGKEKKVGE